MDIDSIRTILSQANMTLPPDILAEILEFLEKHIGRTSENLYYQVFAALGIVGEVRQVRTVNSGDLVSCGMPLETVLRHLGSLSKERLLEVVARQCKKWREAPAWLAQKLDSIKLSYRFFKKYRAVFEGLAEQHCPAEMQNQFTLLAIFWIVFLFIKHECKERDNTIISTTILYCLFCFVFGEVLTTLPKNEIAQNFRRQFSECDTPSEEVYKFYSQRVVGHLSSTHKWRYGNSELNLETLATSEHFMTRFLDDISNRYDRLKPELPKHSVDEISFLQLDKTLTPQAIKREFNTNQAAISKRMTFNDDNDEYDEEEDDDNHDNGTAQTTTNPNTMVEQIPEPPPMPPKRFSVTQKIEPMSPMRVMGNHPNMTPICSRHQSLAWVNRITSRAYYEQELAALKSTYRNYTGEEYQCYEEKANGQILASINAFTPSCSDFAKRKSSIFSFFVYFISLIQQKHSGEEEKKKAIFSRTRSFDSILCLSVSLFNFAYSAHQSSYRKHCSIFGIGIVEGQIPINWFGLNADMPKIIDGYLYDLEKKILIQEMWEDGEGFDLLSSPQKYQGQMVLKRLKQHADERTQELCESMNTDRKQITKVVNLVRFILEKRQGLLKDHKIDQIIVCSIASILSINRSSNFSLEKIFDHYNKLLHSLNINRSTFYDREGQQTSIINYYNDVFLSQVDEIIANEEQARKVLDTPIRLERRKSHDLGQEITPLSLRFRQGAFGNLKLKKENNDKASNSYRRVLANQVKGPIGIKESEPEHEHNEVLSPVSPYFGVGGVEQSSKIPKEGLSRIISFGSLGSFADKP